MVYSCELLDRPAQPVLAIRTRARAQDLGQVIGPAYGAIIRYAGQMGAWPCGSPYVAYFNRDMQDLDLEIGFPFAAKLEGREPVVAGEIPGGRAAACLHVGPYQGLTEAYAALAAWMEENGYEAAGPAYEFYLNDPQSTAPEALRTQIVFPIA